MPGQAILAFSNDAGAEEQRPIVAAKFIVVCRKSGERRLQISEVQKPSRSEKFSG